MARRGVSCPSRRLPQRRQINMEVHRIQEHDRLPECFRPDCWAEAFGNKNLFKWMVSSEGRHGEYSAYYRIGAEWVDDERALGTKGPHGHPAPWSPSILARCSTNLKGRLRVRAVLAKAAKRTKQPYAGTALYSLAEDARATPAQDKELKGLALALCKPEANHAALIAATFGLEQDIMSCGY